MENFKQANIVWIFCKENDRFHYLRLDISVKDPVSVHMLYCFKQLVHVVLYSRLWKVILSSCREFQAHLKDYFTFYSLV